MTLNRAPLEIKVLIITTLNTIMFSLSKINVITLSIMTLSTTMIALSITTLSIMTLNEMTRSRTLSIITRRIKTLGRESLC
jgi:hypothetical protein